MESWNGISKILMNRKAMLKELCDLEKIETVYLVQKAKLKWGGDTDENLKFFHNVSKQMKI